MHSRADTTGAVIDPTGSFAIGDPLRGAGAGSSSFSPVPGDRPASSIAGQEVGAWFDERVGPLVGAECDECAAGEWVRADAVPGDDELAAVERRLARADGAPPRTALTIMVGWWCGYLASVIAAGVIRDGILLRVARPGALEVLRHPDGWLGDARPIAPGVAVAEGHPWCGRPGVETVFGSDVVRAEALDEIRRACGPALEAIARRSRRGRAGLWAQVADSVGWTARSLHDASPGVDPQAAIAATRRLLDTSGAPWRQTPNLWTADLAGRPGIVTHRGSCCLYYQCDLAAAAERHEPDPEYVARFGHDDPNYCTTCLHREPGAVEARLRFHREQEDRT